jgi:hypothetical protein
MLRDVSSSARGGTKPAFAASSSLARSEALASDHDHRDAGPVDVGEKDLSGGGRFLPKYCLPNKLADVPPDLTPTTLDCAAAAETSHCVTIRR